MYINPYANLSPVLILDAIESLGFICTGNLFALNSYENRVYQIEIENGPPLIAKFYRPNRWSDECILEEHQFSQELAARDIPIIAPWQDNHQKTLYHYQNFRFALFPRWSGRALELDNFDHLEWMGRFIGRLHAVGACRPFAHRPALNVQTHGYAAYHFLIQENFIPDYLKANYCEVVETALKKIEQHFEEAGALQSIRLHGDIHAGNVLWSDAGPHIVDLDDCVSGPAIQDLWMLLSGDAQNIQIQLDRMLHGYCLFHDFNFRERSLIEPLRTLRMLQYSAWIASRWQEPTFLNAFSWFNTPHYWQEQLRHFQEQITAMDSIS